MRMRAYSQHSSIEIPPGERAYFQRSLNGVDSIEAPRRKQRGMRRACVFNSKGQMINLTRRIPSSGKTLPVIGLGAWQTFDVGPSPAERAPPGAVLRTFVEGGREVDRFVSDVGALRRGGRRPDRPAGAASAPSA